MITKTLLITAAVSALALASPALAKSSTTNAATTTGATSAEISCVGKAVATRESAFGSGESTYQNAVAAAYEVRQKSLASAYATGTSTGVTAGIKSAWANFDIATKAASAAWSTKRLTAWSSFKTAAATCKAPSGIVDSSL